MAEKSRQWAFRGGVLLMFLRFFEIVWSFFDILMFLAAAVTINLTMYRVGWLAFGISLTVTFIFAGLLSEMFSQK